MAGIKEIGQILERSRHNVSQAKSINKVIMLITSILNPQRIRLHKEFRLLLGS